jgi:RNA polymerase sigma-70 factor (ECF subfamily)
MNDDDATDQELVGRTLAGDADAFAALHRRYYARVYRFALLRCHNPADAEDIAAETFLRAITHLPAFRFKGESVLPWLSRICANLVTDAFRQRSSPTVSLDTPTAEGVRALLEGLTGNAPDPHALAERHEVRELVRAAVRSLPPDQADAVLLRFGGDLPLKEIGAALGKSEGAVKALLHRAMIGLRKRLLEGAREAEVFENLRAGARTTTAGVAASRKNRHGN